MARFADNNHGVNLGTRLESGPTDSPTTQTFHGLSIVMNNNLIGRIQKWNPKMYSRKGEHIYELNYATFGRPVDYVPGINEQYSIDCEKIEIWDNELEEALGYGKTWDDLMDQTRPFTIDESIYKGQNIYRTVRYTGCWFTDKNNAQFGATDTPTIKMTANISFVSRKVVVQN